MSDYFWSKKRRAETMFAPMSSALGPFRHCEVDGKVCRFHRFVEEDRLLLKVNTFMKPEGAGDLHRRAYEEGIVGPCCSTEVLRETRALIEWPDGSLGTVCVDRVRFLDRLRVEG